MKKSGLYNYLRQISMIGERITLFLMGYHLGEKNIPSALIILIITIGIHYLEYEFEYLRTMYIQDEQFHEHGINHD